MLLRPSDLSWLLGPFATAGPCCYCALPGIRFPAETNPAHFFHRLSGSLLPLLVAALMFGATTASAQDTPPPLPTPRADSTAASPDTTAGPPTRARPQPTPPPPSTPQQTSASGLDKPITFSASDSLIIRFDDTAGDSARLIGNASVTYGDATLQAHTIDILFDVEELHARGASSETGPVGMPTFTQGEETFSGASFAYNMGTERGRVVGARTQFQEGFIQAGVAKVREDSTIFIRDGLYTTCNCEPDETPSYSMRSNKMKVVDQKYVYTGPIQLYIYNIPTPFWLPFGFLPYQEGRRSGILAPEYGEDQRGFYLRNFGYYWAMSDYTDLQLRAGIWSKGSWQVNPSFRYNRRDRYNGGVSVDYVRERSGEKDDPGLVIRNNVSLRWTHSQTLNPTARVSANVNLTSSSYLQTVSDQYDDNVRQSIGSSVQYSKRWQGGRSLSLNMRQNQVLATGSADLTLPELSFNQSTLTPFKRSGGGSRNERWYERLQLSYNGRVSNRYSFQPLSEEQLIDRGDPEAADIAWYDALFDQNSYERATGLEENRFDFKATHRVPLSAPFSITRLPLVGQFRLNVSPNFSYSEEWFLQTERRRVDTTNTVIRDYLSGFFALRQFNTGVSANTTFYGLFPIKAGPYQGVRHTVRPNFGFSYRPDFSSDFWGYTRTYTDTSNQVIEYDIVSGVPSGRQQALSFGIDNTFETKHVAVDSTGEERSRVLKLFNVNVRSNYNFSADSLKLAPISVTARTNVLGKLNLNFSSTFSPYAVNAEGNRQIDRYLFSLRDFRFARLTQMSLRGDFRVSSRRGSSASRTTTPSRPAGLSAFNNESTTSLGLNDPFASGTLGTSEFGEGGAFSDWSLNVSFTYSLSKPFNRVTNRSATVNTGFDFNVTPTWKVRGQTGYDFERKEIVTTTLNILKDLECWEMSFRWIPFGRYQSWGFDLHVKSGKLRELLRIRQPRADRDRGFGL